MGSRISPVIGQGVMDDLLQSWILKLGFDISFFYKHVDDIVTSVPFDKVDGILVLFNSYNRFVQFTVEMEHHNWFPFLDTKVVHLDRYQKPTSRGRYMNYHSYHGPKIKSNLVIGNRILNICQITIVDANLRKLNSLFVENSQLCCLVNEILLSTPLHVVAAQVAHRLFRQHNILSRLQGRQNNTINKFTSLPYIKELAPRLIRIIIIRLLAERSNLLGNCSPS